VECAMTMQTVATSFDDEVDDGGSATTTQMA
jgi:hypothetical protein